ncbi:hypothetical protein [Streptomyces sp. URMC 123]|uniref:hypothetical protein n=1 Tax=Streptomyces sp. URMC 123 TaxID=3423403 RepID=UPI003F1C250C
MNDDVKAELRRAAEAHRPDRARMLARVRHGMAAPREAGAARARRRTAPASPRIALAALAVTGVVAVAGYGVAATVRDHAHRPVAPGATAHAPAAPGPSAPTAGTRPDGGRVLRAEGAVDPHSNAYWAQSNLTVEAGEPLTALVVELRVARTDGVATTGHWQTRPAEDFDVSVREEGGVLRYRWALKPGRTVPPGRHVFAGQYNHAEGERAATADTYRVTARAGGTPHATEGGFRGGRS